MDVRAERALGVASSVDRRDCADALWMLAAEAMQRAKSGDPGVMIGMADIAEVLWRRHLRHNPLHPSWPDRDRFVLSNGHASMLLYALLHLSGYDLELSELQRFRQLHSRTPGHPEYGKTPGVETTTGSHGQGFANAVGMALAERTLAAEFNREDAIIVDHYTYVFVGDGCLMEGISHEAASLAGTFKLGKLIAFYADNGISIDEHVSGWFTDDTPARFAAYGWHVVKDVDGQDAQAIDQAIWAARAEIARPSLICCKMTLGHGGSHQSGTEATHGAPLGEHKACATYSDLGWLHEEFAVPSAIAAAWDARPRGRRLESEWRARFEYYTHRFPTLATEFRRRIPLDGSVGPVLPADWDRRVERVIGAARAAGVTPVATRKASQETIAQLAAALPELLGGSAGLTDSTQTRWARALTWTAESPGDYVHYGAREFSMAALMNGVALHGGFLPYGGSFLVFSDYARNAIRMSALMRQRVVYVLSHDSIGLGEDGPTHQPVEQAASLRLIPNLDVWRPCDRVETAVAWTSACSRVGADAGPSALLLSKQTLPRAVSDAVAWDMIARGGYVLRDISVPVAILVATGSEVSLAMAAQDELVTRGFPVRVVSMPCTRRFDRQSASYKQSVLLPHLRRIILEAGASDGWWKYAGHHGAIIGVDRFGASAHGTKVFEHVGFSVEAVVDVVLRTLQV